MSREVLLLWDVDHTLLDIGRLGHDAFVTAFQQLFGRDPVGLPMMAGRTDRYILGEILARSGLVPDTHLEDYRAAAEIAFVELAGLLTTRGRVLPGAAEALRHLAAEPSSPIVQSLLTGNIRRFAELKLRAFALDGYVDFDSGGYGWAHAVRANLVGVARTAAEARYGNAFAGRATVLVGDTPLDVEAALVTGASVIAVATGRYGVDELAAAGAHVVLRDLTATGELVEAIHRVTAG